MWKLATVLLGAAVAAVNAASSNTTYASVTCSPSCIGGQIILEAGTADPNAVAWSSYSDMTNHPSSFGQLGVHTNGTYFAADQWYAAGYLEGYITAERISQQYTNIYQWIMGQFNGAKTIPPQFQKWFTAQSEWARAEAVAAGPSNSKWYQYNLLDAQFNGTRDGYQAYANLHGLQAIDTFGFQLLNGVGDLLDLVNALTPSYGQDWENMRAVDVLPEVAKTTHCSGLVKVTGNYSELFVAHSAWFVYQSMIRVYKSYYFDGGPVTGRTVSFSGYPGMLSSLDDFYLMKDATTHMAMVQTTNNIFNRTLYDVVTPQSILAWQRVRMATHLATNGEEWHEIAAWYNSGTYNNAYMVVNWKLFTPGQALPAGLLWYGEQIPGEYEYADTTETLERGYWPSYNVPYFKDIYTKSGYPTMTARFVDDANKGNKTAQDIVAGLNYQLAPRAQIFRRDQGKVVDFTDFQAIMRYNNYKEDPYAAGDPMKAICSRGDLAGFAGGCYDTKATSYSMAQSMQASVINGPTVGNGNLPPFSWSEDGGKYSKSASHVGQPETFDFVFETVSPPWTA